MDKCVNSSMVENKVVYLRKENPSKSAYKFKTVNTPYYDLNGEILNNNIAWKEVLETILSNRNYNFAKLSRYLEVKQEVLNHILENNFSTLPFKAGAKLLAIQDVLEYQAA